MPEPASRNREPCTARTRCQTWTSNSREKRSPGLISKIFFLIIKFIIL